MLCPVGTLFEATLPRHPLSHPLDVLLVLTQEAQDQMERAGLLVLLRTRLHGAAEGTRRGCRGVGAWLWAGESKQEQISSL